MYAAGAPGGRWAFAALRAGNIVLAVGAPLVRLADTGPVATGFWRMAIALPFLALLAWRETGGRMPSRAAIGVAMAAGLFFALDLAAWHMGIARTKVANGTLFGNCARLLLVRWGIFIARTLTRGRQGGRVCFPFPGGGAP